MNEKFSKKLAPYLIMMSCVGLGYFSFHILSPTSLTSPVSAASDQPVQRIGYLEAVKNGNTGFAEGNELSDSTIQPGGGKTQEGNDLKNTDHPRQTQFKKTENRRTHFTNQAEPGYTVVHNGFKPEDMAQQYVQYTYKLGGMRSVIVGQCEQRREPNVRSDYEDSRGMFQINKPSYPGIVNDPRFKSDWKREIEQAVNLVNNGTTFKGPNRINQNTGNPCWVDAEKYFTLLPQE